MKGLTDIPGIRVGQASDFDALTGCTAILCDGGAVGGLDIRGSATGTAELDVLTAGHVDAQVDAIVLAGGSAYGLEAAAGVRKYLGARGIGVKVGPHVVPIVPAAILFDLGIGKGSVRPTREMGEAAAAGATADAVQEGAIGAGTGATVGKLFGMAQAMKGGIGCATVEGEGGVRVSSLVAVNAFGDVRDPETGKLIAGARRNSTSTELADTAQQMKLGARGSFISHNTTLAVIATNARLTKVAAAKLAQMAGLGMARTIYPVNTMFDGDIVFALSKGDREADLNTLGVLAADAVAQAIVRAVRLATTLGGVPGLGSHK
jgi:L-aminopeptidase/D-esterase-like protein